MTQIVYDAPPVDSLIAAYEARLRADSLEKLFWRATVATQDSLVRSVQKSRDAYRQQAQRPSHVISDIGGGAIVGWGIAEKCEACVAAGAATILLPRALGLLGRVF